MAHLYAYLKDIRSFILPTTTKEFLSTKDLHTVLCIYEFF